MADENVFAPRNALRRTPPRAAAVPAPVPAPDLPRDSSVSISPEPVLRAMTSPLRDDPNTPAPLFSSALAEQTPRASTVEPVTPSYVRQPSSAAGTTARRKATTPHAIRGYSSRATPHKNQSKRRTSRFKGEEEDDLRDALRQFSRITAPTTKPFIPTPKQTIDPAAAASRRRTLTRLSRDLAALSSSPSPPPLRPPPRLSNVSLKLIGRTLTSAAVIQNDDETSLSPPPQLTSPLQDADDADTMDIDNEVARRAVPENDRRMSFLPNPFDRFRDFDDVVMDDSIVQEAGAELIDAMFEDDDEAPEFGGELSFADRTADLQTNDEEGVSFNPPDLIPDDETDFRLEHEQAELDPGHSTGIQPEDIDNNDVEISPEAEYDQDRESDSDRPLISAADISSPTPGGFHTGFVDSDISDDEPLPPIQDDDEDVDVDNATDLRSTSKPTATAGTKRKRKELPLSAHGIPYPSIPAKTVKVILARTGAGAPKLSKEALAAVMQATEAYFENLGGDLGGFARHAKRRTVEEADVIQVLRRHRLLSDRTTVFSLAAQHLPRELLQDIRIQVPRRNIPKTRRRRVPGDNQAEEEA
ncbi:hypothetical protein TWF696_005375 [Orbilia brochopaga]|uniref:CENP-T/Histone H4 histone fold domain-containing protein n=1 Tax=Orbilia brochopaga TaxID=3140254 RepID=A0AAV9V3V8_9PEZI